MRVIETEAVRRHERSGLLDMSAERIAQNGMQNMCTRMIRSDARAPVFIDLRLNLIACRELSIFDLYLVNSDTANRRISIRDPRHPVGRRECSDIADLSARSVVYVDKILKGVNPAELPIEQPRRLFLVINRKTANTLGLTVPPALLLQADQVIQ